MGGLWGLRLLGFLWRGVLGESEDGRYRAMREAIGDSALRWFACFQARALVRALFALRFEGVSNLGDELGETSLKVHIDSPEPPFPVDPVSFGVAMAGPLVVCTVQRP